MTYCNGENEHLRIGRRGPVFAPVSRCVPSQEHRQVKIAPGIFDRFGPIFDAPKSGQEKGIDAFLRQCLFTAARSASCRKGLRRFEIDADYRTPNVLWRYSL